VAVLGLAFKPGTDDIRESPGIDIIRHLEFRGASLRAHDPQAMKSAKNVAPNATYCDNPYDAAKGADALAIITEWPEYGRLDWAKIKGLMKQPLVFDGRNLLDPAKMAQLGFEYYSIGR